jgi:hypothetical protein
MDHNLSGKKILIVQGSSLAGAELMDAFDNAGARIYLTTNIISAFDLLRRIRFDGAVVDKGLHNVAFELCSELQELKTPYICCTKPHQLQKPADRLQEAAHGVWRIADMIESRPLCEGNHSEQTAATSCEASLTWRQASG